MFPNLDAEMARRKITRAELAGAIGIQPTTLSFKLNGKALAFDSDSGKIIGIAECIKIRDAIDKTLKIDYLFATDTESVTA